MNLELLVGFDLRIVLMQDVNWRCHLFPNANMHGASSLLLVFPACVLCIQDARCKMLDASYTLLFIDPLVPLVTHKFGYIDKFVGFIFSCPYFVVLKDCRGCAESNC
jgi:hypothetical protein